MSEARKAKQKNERMEWIYSLIIVILIVFVLRFFLISAIIVKGESMQPTFQHNDVTIINKLSYKIGNPKNGDIIVCSYDNGTQYENIIKRVIGVPGDVIELEVGEEYEYHVVVNGITLDEPYTKELMYQPGDIEYPFTVPENCYFVMGDNRNNSNDSRSKYIGAIPKSNILGKVFLRVLPFSNFKLF
ncbi:MAG: signal peptidase I [Anaerotignaceae bacterium]